MINDFIKKLQGQSDKSKEKLLWGVVVVSAIMSLAIWSLSFESYKAVFNQPLDNGMMEGLKASVSTELINTKTELIDTNHEYDDDASVETENTGITDNEVSRLRSTASSAPLEMTSEKEEIDEVKYYRLPVDEN